MFINEICGSFRPTSAVCIIYYGIVWAVVRWCCEEVSDKVHIFESYILNIWNSKNRYLSNNSESEHGWKSYLRKFCIGEVFVKTIYIFFNLGKISPYLCTLYVKKCKEEAYSVWKVGKKIHIEAWGHHDVRVEKTSVLSSIADKQNCQYYLPQRCEQ